KCREWQHHPFFAQRHASVAQLAQAAHLIAIRGPVADPYEARLRHRLAPEAELERRGRALRDPPFLPANGDVEDVPNTGDERREEGPESRARVRSEVPVLERHEPTGPERLSKLLHATNHARNARPPLREV